jgi:Glucose / Sorbosone dehydrogenase
MGGRHRGRSFDAETAPRPFASLPSANLVDVIRAAGIVAVSLALLVAGNAQALTLEQVGGSFEQPTYVTSDPGDANRLFVVERKGTIQLVQNGVKSKFADLRSQVACGAECEGERGLMSIALSPRFASDGRLYVDYANDVDGKIHIEELTAFPDHQTANPATLKPLLEVAHSDAANHNGGQIQFGPDDDLYISTGDGGGGDDQFHHAQDLSSQLGKILRLEPDSASPAAIWSYGLRNPFRFSFDRLTGDMVIGDVGQEQREEIDFAPSPFPGIVGGDGVNFGWNCREGFVAGPGTDLGCAPPPPGDFAEPVFDYPHTPDPDLGGSGRCSIIGGYVVRDPGLGALYGHYVYADLCSGAIRALQLPAAANSRAGDDCSLRLELNNPVSFGEDSARRLYVVEQGGRVYRLTGLPPATCPAPLPLSLPSGEARPQPKPTFIGIKAQRRRVERGKAALLTVFVSPCDGHRGQTVELLRNGRLNGSRYLSRACTARFLPRIHRGTRFAAKIREGRGYLPGESRRLTIRLAHRRHH